ncbi:hypothetical protein [Flavobacterium sp. RSP15]|uniref:hypothetical protein n=1 Tax=Flavobacterium sp. RSP15 TaxID=2497485 RepID=UPI000F842980|nr:hypothetical protein [Flavobacterium sp. RSP15]RTY86004.1 hypothetical protein EKM00_11865 [Flavobacterium sp. RSP15]
MEDTDKFYNHTEKIIEQNALFLILESKVIFNTGREKVILHPNQITNVRLVKNRNYTLNILILVFLIVLSLKVEAFFNVSILFHFLFLGTIIISGILTSHIKNYSYVMLINKGRFDYDEIFVSRKNVTYANDFVSEFKSVQSVVKNFL